MEPRLYFNMVVPKNCIGRELNKPFPSDRKFKKKQVCVRDKDKVLNIHYGDNRYQDFTQHKDKQRKKSFRARHGCDSLTKKDKTSARFWACEDLWD